MLFFIGPLAAYEGISSASEHISAWWESRAENFRIGYYDGTAGRFVSFFKGLTGFILNEDIYASFADTSAGSQDRSTEADLAILEDKSALAGVYSRKLDAVKGKLEEREKMIASAVSGGAVTAIMQSRYESEWAHRYDGDENTQVVFDGTTVMTITSAVSDRQALELLVMYSTQINSSLDNIRLSGLLRWMGYSAGAGNTLVFRLGENSASVSIPAWTGTYMPQYLVDEGASRGMQEEYRSRHGASAADLMMKISCPDFGSIQADTRTAQDTVTDIIYTETACTLPKYHSDGRIPTPRYGADGTVLNYSSDGLAQYYSWRKDAVTGLNYLVPNSLWSAHIRQAGTVTVTARTEQEVQRTVTSVHVSYTVPVTISCRSVDDLKQITWDGWENREVSVLSEQRHGDTGRCLDSADTVPACLAAVCPSSEKGTLTSVNLGSDTVRIYTPAHYSTEKQYNVLFVFPGGTGSTGSVFGRPTAAVTLTLKDMLDRMIHSGTIAPLIVVAVPTGNGSGSVTAGKRSRLTDYMENIVLPYVTGHYSTYAYGTDHASAAAARDHFAVYGSSTGAWYLSSVLYSNLTDCISWIAMTAGSCGTSSAFDQSAEINLWLAQCGSQDASHKGCIRGVYENWCGKANINDGENAVRIEVKGAGHETVGFDIFMYNALAAFF